MRHPSPLRVVCAILSGLGGAFLGAQQFQAAPHFPLEITNIRNGMSLNNRISRAYPGIEYNMRAAVVGGVYPFSFELQDAPPGMTIDRNRGEVSWRDPQASAAPTLTVRDAKGDVVSVRWRIEVGRARFLFIDSIKGTNSKSNGCAVDCGDGTVQRPWRTISDMARGASGGEFVYFMNGTYSVGDLPRGSVGSPWERVEFVEGRVPVVWMAYPGHRPVIDFGYGKGANTAALIRFRGENVYVDGFETINSHIIGFQTYGGGATFRRLAMHRHGPGIEGSNASMIMTLTNPTPYHGMVVQDSQFYNSPRDVMIKIYAQSKLLIEDNVFYDALEGIALKEDVRQFTVRRNTFYRIMGLAIGGNMHERTTGGAILFNNVRASTALDVNQNGMAREVYVYRNTLVGRVKVRNTDAVDGPFVFYNNVIVSEDGGDKIYREGVQNDERIVLFDNLVGGRSKKLVDDGGNLTTPFQRYLGTHGHQLIEDSAKSKDQ